MRDDASSARPAARPPMRRPGVMDGVVRVAKPAEPEVVAPEVPAAPAPVAMSDVLPVAKPGIASAPAEAGAPTSAAESTLESKLETELEAAPVRKLNRAEKRAAKKAAEQGLPEGTMSGGRKFDHKKFFLIALAVIVLLLTAYVAYDTWLTNTRAEAVLSSPPSSSTNPEGWNKDDEGKDESEVPESALANYRVEASLPRALYIDKLDVAARVMPMSVNTDGSIQAPKNIFDAGWYNGSVKPGETGAMFIDGHASGATRQGLLAYLDKLVEGDEIVVEKGSGEKLTYKVTHVETVPLADVDMRKVLLPYDNASKALNLMTCTGKWLPLEKTYDHRVIVYTEQV